MADEKCHGGRFCEGHIPPIQKVIVSSHDWKATHFNYCQKAIQLDKDMGFDVKILEGDNATE